MSGVEEGRQRPLPNDDGDETGRAETAFLQCFFRPYEANRRLRGAAKTVIYSRASRTHYESVGGDPPTSEHLRSTFQRVGHTLSVDNAKSYVRACAFDLDCLCRAAGGGSFHRHLDETLAREVCDEVKSVLKKWTGRKRFVCVLWNRGCGYHLYTDVSVSMPTHLLLGQQLNATFALKDVLVEVPEQMPLPYSAKVEHEPYTPLSIDQDDVPLLGADPFYDRFELLRTVRDEHQKVAVFATRFDDTPLYMVNTKSAVRKYGVPIFSTITDVVSVLEDYLSPLADYVRYVNDLRRRRDDVGGDDDRGTSDITAGGGSALVASEAFARFVATFDRTHFNDNSGGGTDGLRRLVEVSAGTNGALYLQHYVAALHKAVQPVTDGEFRDLLRHLYGRVDDPTVARLVRLYDVHTFDGYNDTYEHILDYLSFVHVHQIDVTQSVEEHIDKFMCTLLHVNELASWTAHCRGLRTRDEREAKKQQALDMYVTVMSRTKYLIHYNGTWYALDNAGCYKKIVTMGGLPCLNRWVVPLDDAAKRYVENQTTRFSLSSVWSICDFMFATWVGVFNSITGLYTAKTSLLRFTNTRRYAVWGLEKELKMYDAQNADVLALGDVAKRFADTVCDRTTELFLHFQVIPAMLHIQKVYQVNEAHLAQFFELFENHENFATAHFLVEYYPVDAKFVYLVLYLYNAYGLQTLLKYGDLKKCVFEHQSGGIDASAWAEKFRDRLAAISYDSDASDHMSRLLSIDGGDFELTEDFCLFGVLIAVCMIQCLTFRPLVRAFDIVRLPQCADDTTRVPRLYLDAVDAYAATLDCYKRIMETTVNAVYGDDLSPFENALASMTVQMCMSSCFDPPTVRELVSMVSAVFVPRNISKKMLVFTGRKDCGKSYFCDLIQELNEPCVGRFADIRVAVDRANVTTRTNVTIVNEINNMNPHHMKSVTGNDGESAQVFYSQNYEMQKFQSLIYGATNTMITFVNQQKPFRNIDRTTVERIHALTLNGQQVYESESQARNLFTLVADSQFYADTVHEKTETAARALAWLTYTYYYHRRDVNYKPTLDATNPDVLLYQKRVYFHNNTLFQFLTLTGITEEKGFHIDRQSLVTAVRRSFDEKANTKLFSTYQEFESQFNMHYSVNLKEATIVKGLQFAALVEHVKSTMQTVRCEGAHIDEHDLEGRLTVYGTDTYRDNAREYFERNNGDFDHRRRVFVGVKFARETTDSYSGNEISDLSSSSCRPSSTYVLDAV